MNLRRFFFNYRIGYDALMTNKVRALLTSLGIIFGVAAVISMLAIGAGAEQEILQQMKEVGSNNIIIKPKELVSDPSLEDEMASKKTGHSEGLTLKDAINIEQTLPTVKDISPEIEMETVFLREGTKTSGKLVGVKNFYFEISNLSLAEGSWFSARQSENSEPVCIIGSEVKTRFFPTGNPLGQKIKCGNNWLTVVGVLADKNISEKNQQKLSIRNYNHDIYTPIQTFLLRYKNRSLVTNADILQASFNTQMTGEESKAKENYNQLDRLVINVENSEMMQPTSEVIDRILKRRHNKVEDFEIIVPELMLKQEQKTKKLFNLVLGVIASISLIVGGIGIMNIMLASVLERIREIGLRQSLGATRRDIVLQFMSESVTLSLGGGFIGIALGLLISFIIRQAFGISTIVTFFSVFISFSISIAVGLIFGIWPARKAAMQNPVESLRHD
jgi:putative ABC transport system permease protein